MSDYEGEGWRPVDLSIGHDPARYSVHAFTEYVGPQGRPISDVQDFEAPNSKKNKKALNPRTAKTFHPLTQNIQPRAHHATGGRPIERSFVTMSDNQNLESFKLFQKRPDRSDDIYELDIAWQNLLRAIPDTAEIRSRDIARKNLDNISVFSEAFIKTPEPDSTRIEIWGTVEQCSKAKTRLQAWERHLRSTGTRPSQRIWLREPAYDGRREDRKLQERWQELADQTLQEYDDSYFKFEAYLVWPQDYDLDAYTKKYEDVTLKEISKEFRCRFKHERKTRPRHTKVQAETEGNLLSAYQRLINLVKEMIANRNRGTHGNFSRFPTPNVYRDNVTIEQEHSTRNAPYHIMFSGNTLPESKIDEYLERAKLYDKQNRKEIQSSMDVFFKSLHVSECHIRLRVSFGQLLLRGFTKPKNGSLTFPHEEFLNILASRRTDMMDPVLRDRGGNLTLLVEKLSAMDEFQHPEEFYKQVFEFKGTDATNRLLFEREMQPGFDFDEPQVCGQRWLTFKTYGQNENVLGLRMFDFESPGYMIRADAYDLFTNDSIIRDMEAFQSAISYKPSRDGVKAYPKLRSTFPNHDKLVAVTEVTAVRFRFMNTDGIVEVRREDIYLQNSGPPSKLPDNTRFEMVYFYPEWDSLLGELSNIKPGEDVSWHRDILTFFPNHIDPDRPRSLPKGFKTFMRELHQLQSLLAAALSNPSEEHQK